MRPHQCLIVFTLAAALLFGCSDERIEPWQPVPPTPPAGQASVVREPDPPDHASSTASFVLVTALFDLPFAAMLATAVALAWTHRRRARAEASLNQGAPLTPGPAVIFGVVEAGDDRNTPVVAVRITQSGTERLHKGSWSHTWSESSRVVNVSPFYVRRDDGVRVRVEPDERVVLKDDLSRIERMSRTQRAQVAELAPGERVHVSGTLSGAAKSGPQAVYRGAPEDLVLRAPMLGRMLISTEAPGDTESKSARFHTRFALLFGVTYFLVNVFVLLDYRVLSMAGTTVTATATATQHRQVWVKPKNQAGRWVSHYWVRGEYKPPSERKVVLEDESDWALYGCVKEGACRELRFVILEADPSFRQLGAGAGVTGGRMVVTAIVTLFMAILYLAMTVGRRPWYARSTLNDHGSGKLDET